MKKLLSLILALTLIVGMLPTVFATETVVWSPEFTFTREAFNYVQPGESWSVDGATSAELLDSTVSTGEWYYLGGLKTDANGAKFNIVASAIDSACLVIHSDCISGTYKGANTLVLDIKLEKDGYYKPEIDYFKHNTCCVENFYLVSKEDYHSKQSYDINVYSGAVGQVAMPMAQGKTSLLTPYVKTIASIDGYDEAVTDYKTAPDTYVSDDVFYLTAGEYYLFMTGVEGLGGANAKYAYIKSVRFNRQPILTASVSKNALMVDDTVELASEVINSEDVNVTSTTEVIYTSSAPSVAKIENNSIVALSEGNAVITAEATVDGIKVSDEINISVKVPVINWSPRYTFTRAAFNNEQLSGSWSVAGATSADLLNRTVSTGEWYYLGGLKTDVNGAKFNIIATSIEPDCLVIHSDCISGTYKGANTLVLDIKLEKDGYYKASVDCYKHNTCGQENIYLISKEDYHKYQSYDINVYSGAVGQVAMPMAQGKTSLLTPYVKTLATVDGYDSTVTDYTTAPMTYTSDEIMHLTAGEYYLFMTTVEGKGGASAAYAYIKSVNLIRQGTLDAEISSSTIEAGKTATLSSVVTSGENVDLTDSTTVTYTSDNTAVAKVVGNVVIGVSEGKANITATATVGGATITDTVEITVTEASAPKTITLAYSNNVDNEIIVKGRNYVRGDEVTLTAEEISGYTFRHWVRGTAESGDWVSADAEYTFTLATNTYLTAVYTANSEDKIVEFFNGNGEYLSEAAVVDGKVTLPATNPKLTGFAFIRWLIGKDTELTSDTILTDDITRAVAEFGSDGTSYTVGATSYGYDDEVTSTSETAVAWFRDGVQVGYGTSYTYYVWGNVGTITSGEGTQKPLVVLDATAKSGARMIEYDAGGKEIVEVGILFGDSASITVDSCEYKATSQRKLSHGQFTAKPNGDETVARGYLIYNDNDTYKVVYSN